MIETESLAYNAGKFSMHDISLRVDKGETLVVLGPTGAGKTVLLELIAGFRRPSRGSVRLDGRDLSREPPEKRGLGFVYQDYLLFPHMGVRENIAYGLRAKGVGKLEVKRRVDAIAERLGISNLLERRTRKLSGGEQQRVALARALVLEPEALLLDEPFSAVDPNTKDLLMRELMRELEMRCLPVIYVTHDQVEAMQVADRVAVMNEGRIVQIGLPEQVFNSPKSEFVARFVGARNIFKGVASRLDGTTVVSIGPVEIRSSISIEGKVHVTIRPEDIIISKTKIESSARNNLRGRVTSIIEKGGVVFVTADCGIDLTTAITRESLREMRITTGDDVYFAFKAGSVNLF
ncbi:MAG: ATP-binding cassette domain-containing protein [Thermoplasmata archaeon]